MNVPKVQTCAKIGCGSELIEFIPMEGKPHHGQFVCAECGRHLAWVGKQMSKLLNRIVIAAAVAEQIPM